MLSIIINRAVILAAGDGDRMGTLTTHCPKVLLPTHTGEQLILSPIKALSAAGVKNILIVVGYLGEKVKRTLGDGSRLGVTLQYVENTDYRSGNAISVWKAESWTQGEPVILCMGDHIIETSIISRLLSIEAIMDTLCIEYPLIPYHNSEEATKVALFEDGSIQDIGKVMKRWDALDTGVFLLTKRFFKTINRLAFLYDNNLEISDVIRFMISKGYRFNTCDVSGCSWMDIDTEEDLKLIQALDY
jgi:choline kinase